MKGVVGVRILGGPPRFSIPMKSDVFALCSDSRESEIGPLIKQLKPCPASGKGDIPVTASSHKNLLPKCAANRKGLAVQS
jgi:hypothetical protein